MTMRILNGLATLLLLLIYSFSACAYSWQDYKDAIARQDWESCVEVLNNLSGEIDEKARKKALSYCLNQLGVQNLRSGRVEEAVSNLYDAYEEYPSPVIELNLLSAMAKAGYWQQVLNRFLGRENEFGNSEKLVVYYIAMAYFQLGEYSACQEYLSNWIGKYPDERFKMLLAEAAGRAGDVTTAATYGDERWKRAKKVEQNYGEDYYGVFRFKFPPKFSLSSEAKRWAQKVLQEAYYEFGGWLDVYPPQVEVVLYAGSDFSKASRGIVPDWSGGFFDGRIRIPLWYLSRGQGKNELRRVLRHEYMHVLVYLKSSGRAPTWIHEALAQLAEPKELTSARIKLAKLLLKKLLKDGYLKKGFGALSGVFKTSNARLAAAAYSASLLLGRYLKDNWGDYVFVQMLEEYAKGKSDNEVLKNVIYKDAEEFTEEILSVF